MESLSAIFPARDFTLIVAIIGLPLLGAIVNGIFGKRLGKDAVRLMALAAVGASFVGSVLAFFMLRAAQTAEGAARFVWTGWKWVELSYSGEMDAIHATGSAASLDVDIAFSIDALSGTMALIVTGVGFLIHLYSTKYMEEDAGYHRFFSYLNLFIFSMLVLILGNSLPVLFIGWEGVGLCSYLLIGFWYSDEANAAAGKKAFITNRIGDFGLLVAMALLVKYTGALDWDELASGAPRLLSAVTVWHIPLLEGASWAPDWLVGPHHVSAATLVGLALFLGCAGKSAQIPLYVWLPDAMAGPTPVSALIHAATMVTAGVYLVCRMAPIFVMSPAAMFVVAFIGVLTAVFAATIALVQNDIKKVLAYSTVSQLGYMFLGVGVGAFTAGFFHVITHAFFKACLFLGAGSVIHAMHARIHDTNASQDVRNMGGLRKHLPTTHWTFLASTLAISGLPLTSGFFSKDEILLKAYTQSIRPPLPGNSLRTSMGEVELFSWPENAGSWLLALGAIGAVMTAFYMFRLYFLTFWGDFKGWKVVEGYQASSHDASHHEEHHEDAGDREGPVPHESPLAMTVPLMVLGALALVGGFWNAHLFHVTPLDEWLEPVFAGAVSHTTEADVSHTIVMVSAIGAFAVGLGLAYWMYLQEAGAPARQLAERFPGLHRLLVDKWRVDELYDEFVIGTLDFIADVCVWIDKWVVDGIIARLSAWAVAAMGHLLRLVQTGRVQGYAAVMMLGTAGIGWFLTMPQPEATVEGDALAGRYTVSAAPGLGYGYRWDSNGDGDFDTEDFGDRPTVNVTVPRGETLSVTLEVKNAFGRTRSRSYTLGARPDGESGDQRVRVREIRTKQIPLGHGTEDEQ